MHHRSLKHSRYATNEENIQWLCSVVALPWGSDCAIFPGSKAGSGYGQITFEGRQWSTHRLAYHMAYGGIPEGLSVLHRCIQTRACCNPAHLYAGTQLDNMQDRVRDGTIETGDRHWSRRLPEKLPRGEKNGAYTHPDKVPRGSSHGSHTHPELSPRGEKHGCAKLTGAIVIEIRRRRAMGDTTLAGLAAEFNTSPANIGMICSGATWRHLL